MSKAESYRKSAEEFARRAEAESDPALADLLRESAEEWLRFAAIEEAKEKRLGKDTT